MSESVSREELLTALERALGQLGKSADELTRLDSAVGDGDMGVTITLGCRAVQKVLPELADQDIGTIIAKCGMAFNGAGPSTLGALLAIAAMRAGKEARGTQELTPTMLVSMLCAAQAGIVEKGKAQPGDKTMLDALGPSINALERELAEGKTLREAAGAAVEAARAGVESTISMKAKSGRAAWITERTLGHPDPGAVVVLRTWEAFVNSTARSG
ncbi:MAG: DAK2 domain-containing protein [Chloroflexota bacterium]